MAEMAGEVLSRVAPKALEGGVGDQCVNRMIHQVLDLDEEFICRGSPRRRPGGFGLECCPP